MKQYIFPSVLLILGLFLIVYGIAANKVPAKKQAVKKAKKAPVYVEYFCKGDTLYPDYVCPDTLIVIDERGLNEGLGLVEQGIFNPSNYQIDSIFHTNCKNLK